MPSPSKSAQRDEGGGVGRAPDVPSRTAPAADSSYSSSHHPRRLVSSLQFSSPRRVVAVAQPAPFPPRRPPPDKNAEAGAATDCAYYGNLRYEPHAWIPPPAGPTGPGESKLTIDASRSVFRCLSSIHRFVFLSARRPLSRPHALVEGNREGRASNPHYDNGSAHLDGSAFIFEETRRRRSPFVARSLVSRPSKTTRNFSVTLWSICNDQRK